MRHEFMCALVLIGSSTTTFAGTGRFTSETVYVETPFDTDDDGRLDQIYVQVDRPSGGTDVPTILAVTPYAFGGNDVPNNPVDVSRLPQDSPAGRITGLNGPLKERENTTARLAVLRAEALERGYASLTAHSIGTGYSTGCPSVGDETETLAAKAVIDWLNGRVRAYAPNGKEVTAVWASGNVGMTGVSYVGTLPNMVATTGVEGLKAIVPVAAISSWYDYYRANGLVVSPGGFIGEDADVLGRFIVRPGACSDAMTRIARTMGREHGDFTPFWQERDYVAKAQGVKAAVFIIHGQSDWNVRQRHAIRWWQALEGQVPLKMWLHKGGHDHPRRADTSEKMWAWFERYVKGVPNRIENEAPIEIESQSGSWTTQQEWPSELTTRRKIYLHAGHVLSEEPGETATERFVDAGKSTRIESLLTDPDQGHPARLGFVMPASASRRMMSGTPEVTLDLAVMNRNAANITVAIVEYDPRGRGEIVTRGWADPQNYADQEHGEKLKTGQRYQLKFELEPKQHTFAKGSRIGVVVTATDYEHTLRPDEGTEVAVMVGRDSFVELDLVELAED